MILKGKNFYKLSPVFDFTILKYVLGYHWNLLFWLCVCYFSADAQRDLKVSLQSLYNEIQN